MILMSLMLFAAAAQEPEFDCENPQYQITGGLASSVVGMWRNIPVGERPAWCDGYEVKFSVPKLSTPLTPV